MFSLSPSVSVKEVDLSSTVPAVATSIVGMVGKFNWGPCNERTLITNERELINTFGELSEDNYEHWYTAWNILQYLRTLYVVRGVDEEAAKNAGLAVEVEGNTTNEVTLTKLNSEDEVTPVWGTDDVVQFFAKYPAADPKIKVAVSNFKNFYENIRFAADVGQFEADTFVNITRASEVVATGIVNFVDETFDPHYYSSDGSVEVNTGEIVKIDTIDTGTGTVGNYYQYLGNTATIDLQAEDFSVPGTWEDLGSSIQTMLLDDINYNDSYDSLLADDVIENDGATIQGSVLQSTPADSVQIVEGVNFTSSFDYYPEQDQFALVVLKDNEIMERVILSMTEGAKDPNGNNIFVDTYLENNSSFIFGFYNDSATELPASISATELTGGAVGTFDNDEVFAGYDQFSNPEEFDVNILIDGANNNATVQGYIKAICESRKDCFGIFTPPKNQVVGVKPVSKIVSNLVSYRKQYLGSTSYCAFYDNWKYQYDKFEDKYRWIPLSGDIAGVFGNSDAISYPWYAPAGFTRGKIRNAVKLAYNPDKPKRDILYKNNINPINNFPSEGATIWGQKTLQTKSSAFDRIDVRRLFIVLEKAISTSSKYFIFDKNTPFTRRNILGMINPFLRDIQGKDGIYAFRVVCDESNNTPAVIDRNELAVDIYIQPSRTAEFVSLTFYATRTGVNFDELV